MHSRPKKSLHAYFICLAYVPILCIFILFLLSLYYFYLFKFHDISVYLGLV